jgi:hypothetical protein
LYERVAKRRAKAQRPLLLKFLQEIGYDDIFNVDEVKEIKTLYDKAQDEMKESYKAELEGNNLSYAEKLEEMMLNKDQAKDGEDEVKDADGKPVVIDGSLPVALNANEAAPSGNQSAL